MLPYSQPEEREQLVHDVFLRMMDKKIIEIYDPEQSNFGGTVYFVTRSIVGYYLDKQERNPLLGLRKELNQRNEFEPGNLPLNVLFTASGAYREEEMDRRNRVEKLYTFVRERLEKPESKRDRSMLQLLNLLREGYEVNECAKRLKVTTSTIYNWMAYIRESCCAR